jgi:hypothetical protein
VDDLQSTLRLTRDNIKAIIMVRNMLALWPAVTLITAINSIGI